MNRRSFFGLGAKIVGAVTLGAHIALDKVGAQPQQPQMELNGMIRDFGRKPLVDWQVTYDALPDVERFKGEAGTVVEWNPTVTRTLVLPKGVYPPEKTNWDGRQYIRYYVSPLGHAVYYRRENI